MTNRINLLVLVLTMFFAFILSSVALAGNAVNVFVEISYPCVNIQAECDTGAAVTREVDGDVVNVYITLMGEGENPATAGPNGESLEAATVSCSSNLGSINSNRFAADAGMVSFNGDASARANVDYTGSAPGVDQITCVVPAIPDPLVGTANANVSTLSSVVVVEPTEEATAIIARKEGPQSQNGIQTIPCGESIMQIFANGLLSTSKNIEIKFAEGSVEGAELRTLESDQPLPIPFTVTLNSGEVKRYVVYSPRAVVLEVEAIDLESKPLDPSNLFLNFCGAYHPPFVYIFCDATFLCPGVDCLTCEASTDSGFEGPYTWELNGVAAYTGDFIEICPEDLNDGYNTLTVSDITNDIQYSETIEFNTPDLGCCGTIDVLQEIVFRSRWLPTVALMTISGTDTHWQLEQYTLDYTPTVSRNLFLLPGTLPWLNSGNQTINQLIIILPAWWTGCCFDGSTESMTVEVCDTAVVPECCVLDTVDIDMIHSF